MIAIEDPDVAEAVGFIHDHATEFIQIEDVVRHVAISRRNLETRFREQVGRPPHAELQRIRLQRAIRFLAETDLSIPKIAEAVGYTTPSYFIQVFRKEHGTTPARYRRRMRAGNETE
jgi:LacI family transcriptional regulator